MEQFVYTNAMVEGAAESFLAARRRGALSEAATFADFLRIRDMTPAPVWRFVEKRTSPGEASRNLEIAMAAFAILVILVWLFA